MSSDQDRPDVYMTTVPGIGFIRVELENGPDSLRRFIEIVEKVQGNQPKERS